MRGLRLESADPQRSSVPGDRNRLYKMCRYCGLLAAVERDAVSENY